MTPSQRLSHRLVSQNIAQPAFRTPAEVVSHLGAMQAQDYEGALWSIGLRLPGCTRDDILRAIANREIIRTWPMRGTLHFVAAQDLRWLLPLTAAKVIKASAARCRQLELDDATFAQSRSLLTAPLQGDKQLPRSVLLAILNDAGIATTSQRGIHILGRLCMEGLLCQGPHNGKEPTFALLEEWVGAAPLLSTEEALARLTRTYFTSHGPASVEDFMRWTGLTKTEAKKGLAMNAGWLECETVDGNESWFAANSRPSKALEPRVDLLPGFDEYVLGYSDRSVFLDPDHAAKIVPGNNGMFMPTILIDGQVQGLWKRTITVKGIKMFPAPFDHLTETQAALLEEKANAYGHFMSIDVTVHSSVSRPSTSTSTPLQVAS